MRILHKKYLFPLIIIASLFIYFLYFYNLKIFLLLFFLITGFIFFFLSLKKIYIFIFIIFGLISVIPLEFYKHPPIPFGINDYHIVFLLFILFSYSIILLFINYGKYKNIIFNIPKQIIALFIVLIVYATIGFIRGNETIKIFREIINLFYYIFPFIFLPFFNITKKHLFYTFEILIIIIFIEYVFMYYYALSHLIIRRLVTRLVVFSVFIFPYTYLSLFRHDIKNKIIKLKHFLMFFIILFVVITALQRSIWITIFFDIIAGIFIYLYYKKFSFRTFVSIIFVLLLIFTILFSIFKIIEYHASEDLMKIIKYRFFTISSTNKLTQDAALNVRLQDNKNVMEKIKGSYLMGEGLGSTIEQSDSGKTLEIVDNAYLVLLWKTGIIGLFVLLSIYFMSFYQLLRIYIKTKNLWDTMIFALILINYLLNGFVNTCFIMYRYTIWIGLIMLIINKWYMKEVNEKDNSSVIGS